MATLNIRRATAVMRKPVRDSHPEWFTDKFLRNPYACEIYLHEKIREQAEGRWLYDRYWRGKADISHLEQYKETVAECKYNFCDRSFDVLLGTAKFYGPLYFGRSGITEHEKNVLEVSMYISFTPYTPRGTFLHESYHAQMLAIYEEHWHGRGTEYDRRRINHIALTIQALKYEENKERNAPKLFINTTKE